MQTQSIDNLEQAYRRIYRRLTIGMLVIYVLVIMLGVAVLFGDTSTF